MADLNVAYERAENWAASAAPEIDNANEIEFWDGARSARRTHGRGSFHMAVIESQRFCGLMGNAEQSIASESERTTW
jgi:hypothetical protein